MKFKDLLKKVLGSNTKSGARVGGRFYLECRDKDGNLKWREEMSNLVPNAALQDLLDVYFLEGTQKTSWYVMLLAANPSPAAGDTLASHSGWTEFTNYDEASRQAWTGVRSGQTISNSAAKAQFTLSTNGSSIGGAGLCSVPSGTSGILACAAPFTTGNKSGDDGDTLSVQYDFTASDNGA